MTVVESSAGAEMARLTMERATILASLRESNKKFVPAETQARLNAISHRLHQLDEEAELKARESRVKAAVNDMARMFGSPLAYTEDLASLAHAGAEIKNGNLALPVSSGKTVELWPVDVLVGELPDNHEERKTWLRIRASANPTYRAAWYRHATLTMKHRSSTAGWGMLEEIERKALSEGLDTAGGFLAPPDFVAEVLARLPEESIFHAADGADVRRTTRDTLVIPRYQPHATSPSVFAGTFVVDWVGETGSPAAQSSQTDVDPIYGMAQIPLRRLRARTAISNDLASDAPYLFASLAQNAAASMAPVEDAAYIGGTGAQDMKPLGILSTPGLAAAINIAGTTANTISNTQSPFVAGSLTAVWELAYALPDQYTEGAMWIMRLVTEKKIRELTDSTGNYPYKEPRLPDGDRSLLYHPVENSSAMPVDGVAGNNPIIFGNLKAGYIVASRAELALRLATENKADRDQTEVIIFSRVGGAVVNTDAFRLAVV